ncbi:MAG: aminotransferase class I/II-fold pyridoxal phosphate-dependent enzyme [Dactylosporangium sp.]|nr:aminotransferase class I/II-fold pyridoxal phosphate-dependent enzyme [Dactylosporangium sp.]
MHVARQDGTGQRNLLDQLTLDQLRERRSVKWRAYPPDVLPLWVAEMDTSLAPPIREALIAAIERGDTGYAHPGRAVEAFAAFAESRFGWRVDPAAGAVMPDVLRGIVAGLEQVTAVGDGVIINPPVYYPFSSFIRFAGRRVVSSPLVERPDGRWVLDLDRLGDDLARSDVTAYLLCNPHNPTGTVFSENELLAIAELSARHGVRVIVDEIHAPMVFPETRFTPFLSLAERASAASSAFVLTAATKAWNLAGLVTGLLIAGPGATADLERVSKAARHGTGLLGVIATQAAFESGGPWLDTVMRDLDANRKLLGDLLARSLPEIRYVWPEATYLAWLDCRGLDLGEEPAEVFLRRGKVALNAGLMFGRQGKGHVRLNFATSPGILAEAVSRMAEARHA